MIESLPLICFYFFGCGHRAGRARGDHGEESGARGALPGADVLHDRLPWLLADAEFLAIALVLVYVGAVMVLFLFVVMMLDIDLEPLREGFVRSLPVGLVVAVVMLVEMLALIGVRTMQIPAPAEPAAAAGMSNTTWLANALFTQFLLPFEVAALILTVAIVAAIPLTLRRRVGVKTQDPARQVMVTARERVRIVKMAAEKPATDPGAAP